MSLLPFHRVDFPIQDIPPIFHESRYEDGEYLEVHPQKDELQRHREIVAFFIREKGGWVYDINTYAPGYLLQSDTMTINCRFNMWIVVGWKTSKGDTIQISKQTSEAFPVWPTQKHFESDNQRP